jgi:hypothetical protein
VIEFHERTFHSWTGPPRTRMVGQFRVGFQLWSVYEDLEHGPTLIFETDGIARRVRQYPQNWRELTAEELYALSWSR